MKHETERGSRQHQKPEATDRKVARDQPRAEEPRAAPETNGEGGLEPAEVSNGAMFQKSEEPDVLLDVPIVKVDEIMLEVDDLRARVSLHAGVGKLVQLDVGADVEIGRVKLEIKGVEAKALLKVHLEQVHAILARTLQTVDKHPELLQSLLKPLGATVGDIGTAARETLPEVGKSVGRATEKTLPQLGSSVGRAAEETLPKVGESAGKTIEQTVPEVGKAAGKTVESAGETAKQTVPEVGKAAGKTTEQAGEATKAAASEVGEAAGTAAEQGAKESTRAWKHPLRATRRSLRRAGWVSARGARAAARSVKGVVKHVRRSGEQAQQAAQ